MNFRKTLSCALVAVSGLAASLAAQVSTATGDLVLGFRVVGSGQGSAFNLEVKLGTFSSFNTAFTNNSSVLTIANLGADLASVYGVNWNTRADLFWGIAGNNASPTLRQVYLSKAEAIDGVQSTPYGTVGNATLNSAAAATGNAVNGLSGEPSLTFANAAKVDVNDPQSWTNALAPNGSNLAFGLVDKPLFENGTVIPFGTNAISDLYQLSNNAITYKGSFALTSDGTVIYGVSPGSVSPAAASAVPEPSTYGLIAVGALALVVFQRRSVRKA